MADMTAVWPTLLVALACGHLCGTVPFGLLITRAAGMGDVRKIGSGNIGATNVLRTGRKSLAALTLLLDAVKGAAPVLAFAWYLDVDHAMSAGLGAFLGHLFPVWLGFKGGKGVATYLGVLVALAWQGALGFAVAWLVVAFATRYSSLAALVAAVAAPLVIWAVGQPEIAAFMAVLSAIVVVKHRANISRLLAGTESRIGAKG